MPGSFGGKEAQGRGGVKAPIRVNIAFERGDASMSRRPQPGEFAAFFEGYLSLVPEDDVQNALKTQMAEVRRVASAVGPDRETYRYAPGKWSIREMLGHVGDGERIFGHRAFCISRNEKASLPGFDENAYVANARFNERSLGTLVDELDALRGVHLSLFSSLSDEEWSRKGTANGNPVSVAALAFMMVGHVRHHLKVLRTKYGIA